MEAYHEIGDGRRVLGAFIGLAGVALDEGQPEPGGALNRRNRGRRESQGVSRVIAR